MKRIILCVLAACYVAGMWAQVPAKLSRQQAIADIDSMAYYIITIHPDPFTVTSESDFCTRIEGAKSSLPDSIKTLDLWLHLAPIVAALGDGHTSLFLNERIVRQVDEGRYFPLPLTVDPYTFEMASEGRLVKSINGIPARKIVDKVVAMHSGESTEYRAFRVGSWPLMVSLICQTGNYVVEFDDGENLEVAGVSYEKNRALMPKPAQKSKFSYHIREDKSVAVMEFNAFDEEGFAPFVEKMFSEIKDKKIENLIIDIRANGGGVSRVGDELFQYISPVPFQQFGKTTTRISEPLRKILFSGKEPRFLEVMEADFGEAIYRDTVIMKPGHDLIPLRENPLRFSGNVYVLTSIQTFSSATDFAWAFQYFEMGTIVGQAGGGYAVCFGDQIGGMLPHSRMFTGVSFQDFYGYGATKADRRPVYPDIEVPSVGALDYVLEKLIE